MRIVHDALFYLGCLTTVALVVGGLDRLVGWLLGRLEQWAFNRRWKAMIHEERIAYARALVDAHNKTKGA